MGSSGYFRRRRWDANSDANTDLDGNADSNRNPKPNPNLFPGADAMRQRLAERASVPYSRRGHVCCQRWHLCLCRRRSDSANGALNNDLMRYDPGTYSWMSLHPRLTRTACLRQCTLMAKFITLGGRVSAGNKRSDSDL